MKIFRAVKHSFAGLGMDPHQSKFNKKLVVTWLTLSLSLTSSVIFLVVEAKTFEDYTANIYTTSAAAMLTIVFTIMIFKMEKLFKLIDTVKKTINKRTKNLEKKAFFKNTNRLVEKWTRTFHFVIAQVSPIMWIFPVGIKSYFVYFTTDLGKEAFKLPNLWWFPFDWKNPTGYLVVLTLQYIVNVYYFTFGAYVVAYGTGTILFALSMIADIKTDVVLINKSVKVKENRLLIAKRLSNFIEFHSSLKKIIHNFLEIYQSVNAIAYIWSLVTICGVMLLIQMEIQQSDSLVLFVAIFYASYAFGTIFVICELGQRLTDAFEEIDDLIEEFDWNLFSHETQKKLLMVLIIAQEPVELRCFGSTSALRESFKKVIKGSFSYFMTMRQFIK